MSTKTFEDNLQELEKIVKDLENGSVPLDDAIKKYTKAMELVNECSKKINDATEKVNKILNSDGNLEDFSIADE
jgi:exodeoxyribonuclease VII small subunit